MQVPQLNGVEVEEDKPTLRSFWRALCALAVLPAFPAKAHRRPSN